MYSCQYLSMYMYVYDSDEFCFQKLNLENNKLTTLKGFPYLQLEELNLKGNTDLTIKEVEEFKEKCKFSVFF